MSVGQQVAEIGSEQIVAGVDQAAAQKASTRCKLAGTMDAAAAMRKELSRAMASRETLLSRNR